MAQKVSNEIGEAEDGTTEVTESLSTVNMGCVSQMRLMEQIKPKFTLIRARPDQTESS